MIRVALPLCLLLACTIPPGMETDQTAIDDARKGKVQILGVAQDGGRPQLNCQRGCCANLVERETVAALAVFSAREWVLIDATPDISEQIKTVGSMPAAIVLSHAHIGHYLGLAQLGREVMGADHLAVWCSSSMANFLRNNGPWSQLVELGNIRIHVFQADKPFHPVAGISILPLKVPHRDEYSDTHGFSITSDALRTLYIPDIDGWDEWGELKSQARTHDLALVDATFFDDRELPGRDMSEIPHPRVAVTMALLSEIIAESELRVIFIHLNHTNPLWDEQSPQAREVTSRGFEVARSGMLIGK